MADRTKIWIADALKRLMLRMPLSKIHVTTICREAEIERPTFYYHFKDKHDLVGWIFIQSALDVDITDLHQAADAMNRMKSEFIFYKRAYEDNSQNALWEYMLEYFDKRYSDRAREILNTDFLDPQLAFSIRLYCYGCVGMTKEWYLNDNITPAETVVEMMFNSMSDSLRSIFFSGSVLNDTD